MADGAQLHPNTEIHPIDIVETLAEHHSWDFDRVADDQIAMAIEGAWRTYALTLAWSGADETLRLISSFEMDPPPARLPALYEVLNGANDRSWTGAFSFWPGERLMLYRYGLVLSGGEVAGAHQIGRMVADAVQLSERFYPAFQLVCWGGESPESALQVAMEEAYGTA